MKILNEQADRHKPNAHPGRPFRVLGAGPAGLTAAITAAQAGAQVEVFEARATCGARFHGDLQGVENWSEDQSFVDIVRGWGIPLDGLFEVPFFETVIVGPGGTRHVARSHRPAVHIVRRGPQPDSLDQSLFRAAHRAGVKVRFGQTRPRTECDVVAVGPRRPTGYVTGTLFRTASTDRTAMLLSRRVAPGGYGYLICARGHGLAAATVLERRRSPPALRRAVLEAFLHQFPDLDVQAPRPFGGFGQFGLVGAFRQGGSHLAGEAAGLQDALWGFGIRTAMISGRLAARAHLEGFDYTAALERELLPRARVSLVNRWVYEQTQDAVSQWLVKAWGWEQRLRGDGLPFIRRLYGPDPIRWRWLGRRASSRLEAPSATGLKTLPLEPGRR